jgi:hypothetical protein
MLEKRQNDGQGHAKRDERKHDAEPIEPAALMASPRERDGWFVKYETVIGIMGNTRCEQTQASHGK